MSLSRPTLTGQPQRKVKVGVFNILAVWLWLGWIANYWLGVLLASTLLLGRFYIALGVLVAFYAVLVALPLHAGMALSKPIGAWIIEHVVAYFAMKMVFEDRDAIANAPRPLIFAIEPHDVLPVSMAAFHSALRWIPGHPCAGLVTSAVFRLPGMKTIFSLMCAHPVDRETFSGLLRSGHSCCFCPGGVQEVMHLDNDDEVVLFLNSRLGFARLAIEHKTPVGLLPRWLRWTVREGFARDTVAPSRAPSRHPPTRAHVRPSSLSLQAVPCFTFGLQGIYSHRFVKGRFAERIARLIGFLPGVYWGLAGIPFGPPRARPLTVVVGKPVPLPARPENGGRPSHEQVCEYHEQFVAAMRELFESHKAEMGMENVSLRII